MNELPQSGSGALHTRAKMVGSIATLACYIALLTLLQPCQAYAPASFVGTRVPCVRAPRFMSLAMAVDDDDSSGKSSTSSSTPVADAPKQNKDSYTNKDDMSVADRVLLTQAKDELKSLAKLTQRGFDATKSQKLRARDLVKTMAKYYDPMSEPLCSFYERSDRDPYPDGPTFAGKWTLVYTDAPDITGLGKSSIANPFPASKLGRIGQECLPPFVNNVIEWKRPDWAKNLPLSGSDGSRVIQKVRCEATAKKEEPRFADLKLVGVEFAGDVERLSSAKDEDRRNLDGPAAYLEENPVEWRGPVKAPFGRIEVMYLDDEIRAVKTMQGYIAVNIRNKVDWF